MKLTNDELKTLIGKAGPFLTCFIRTLNDLIGDRYTLRFIIHNPQRGHKVNLSGIDKETALILWGDEYSQVFPEEYFAAAGAVIKCYCPEAWERRGMIPITDVAMNWAPDEHGEPMPCSQRPFAVMFSANLNYRRTDIYRGLSGKSFGYPFRISSNYPVTGSYPFWHKVEAVLMHKCILCCSKKFDFSELYPDSYIHFNMGFNHGQLTKQEYFQRLSLSKVSWCTAGFMTNETSRLLESCNAGCAVICGKLPNNDLYRGAPFIQIDDWRKVREVTDELLADERRLDEVGEACRQWYKDHFAPDVQARYVASRLGLHPLGVNAC